MVYRDIVGLWWTFVFNQPYLISTMFYLQVLNAPNIFVYIICKFFTYSRPLSVNFPSRTNRNENVMLFLFGSFVNSHFVVFVISMSKEQITPRNSDEIPFSRKRMQMSNPKPFFLFRSYGLNAIDDLGILPATPSCWLLQISPTFVMMFNLWMKDT